MRLVVLVFVAYVAVAVALFVGLGSALHQAPREHVPDYGLFADCLWKRDFVNPFTTSVESMEHTLEFCYRVSTASQR